MIEQDDTDNLAALLAVLQTHGVRRFRSGDLDLELELVPLGGAEPTQPENFDARKCIQCQQRPLGRLAEGLCRECALRGAGIIT